MKKEEKYTEKLEEKLAKKQINDRKNVIYNN